MRVALLAMLLLLSAAPLGAREVLLDVWPADAHVFRVTPSGAEDLGAVRSLDVQPQDLLAVKAPGYVPRYFRVDELAGPMALAPESMGARVATFVHFHPWLSVVLGSVVLMPLGGLLGRRLEHARQVHTLTKLAGPDDLWRGRRLGGYVLGQKLGAGANSMVYRALPVKPGPACAIKILRPDQNLRRFKHEIRICRMLMHPNIVRLLDAGEQDGLSWLALELVMGTTLQELIKETPLDLARFRHIFPQVLDGVAFAHGQGVVHRDLKPDNVLVDGHGHVKVMDFGVAWMAEMSRVTRAGALVGTLIYMAPEQLREDPASPLTDQFALGVMAREMLTLEIPFLDLGPDALYAQRVMGKDPEPMEGVPEALAAVIARMSAADPARRYPTLQEARAALLASLPPPWRRDWPARSA